ncbi:FMN-binding negative transcriptional regulator [Thalassoglobus polymorphus]|nr:FMN-binding negative transcriptional regulator [Thalassoglobus polymorphus]
MSFAETDEKRIREFVRSHPFAQLTSFDGQEPVVSHLPLLLDQNAGDNGQLLGHLAKANSQWKHADGTTVLAVFSGPHAYVSSSWYETLKSVPTWNYTAVHVYGRLHVVDDAQRLEEIVEELVGLMEADQKKAWSMKDAGDDFISQLLRMVIGFTIDIERIEAKFKLSQNHSKERRQLVINALEERTDDDSQQIAALMRSQLDD